MDRRLLTHRARAFVLLCGLCIAAALMISPSAEAATIGQVQNGTLTTGSATIAPTLPSPSTAGNLLVAVLQDTVAAEYTRKPRPFGKRIAERRRRHWGDGVFLALGFLFGDAEWLTGFQASGTRNRASGTGRQEPGVRKPGVGSDNLPLSSFLIPDSCPLLLLFPDP